MLQFTVYCLSFTIQILKQHLIVGMSQSDSFFIFRNTLRDRKYKMLHFHLSPTQFGIPNDRPRHYTIAVLPYKESILPIIDQSDMNCIESIFDVHDAPIVQNTIPSSFMMGEVDEITIKPLSQYLDPKNDHQQDLFIPDKLMRSNSSWCFDIVTSGDCRSACFTSSYGRFVRGTGSVIYTGTSNVDTLKLVSPEERKFDSEWASGIELSGSVRYFSGYEIARLFGFPVADDVNRITEPHMEKGNHSKQNLFQFPPDCTEKQQWKLLGNSINVKVAAKMVTIGLCIMLNGATSSIKDITL